MLNDPLFSLLIYSFLGFLSSLGVGGGNLTLLWLRYVENLTFSGARTINLMFFILSASLATVWRWQKKQLPIRKLLPAILWGSGAAVFSSLIGKHIGHESLTKLFGFLLLFTGIKEVIYLPRKPR